MFFAGHDTLALTSGFSMSCMDYKLLVASHMHSNASQLKLITGDCGQYINMHNFTMSSQSISQYKFFYCLCFFFWFEFMLLVDRLTMFPFVDSVSAS